jgi:hypothetical protein
MIAAVQWICLALGTPLYEIDTNSFIRGGLTWDIYHNPLLNIYIALCTKIWPNVWFIVGLQCLLYAGAASFLANVLFRQNAVLRYIALAIAADEPVTMFYNHSMLAESMFTSFSFLSLAMLLLWMQQGDWPSAALFGAMLGLCFMGKLSAMIHLPLFGLILVRTATPLLRRWAAVAIAILPFAACYAFVYIGQRIINDGDVFTVEGRVRWDFSSALYDSTEAGIPAFSRFVHPYIFQHGGMVQHHETRMELSHLGYKDCVSEWESAGYPANRGINACDSLFGAVGSKILEGHFWQAECRFVKDNMETIHSLNYLDYRFTPGLHYYHPQKEYDYLDSLMAATYHYSLKDRAGNIPKIWRSLDFGNAYMPVLWWLWWGALIAAAILWIRCRKCWNLLALGLVTAIPLVFHFVYVTYKPRLLAPYIVLMLMLVLSEVAAVVSLKNRNPGHQEGSSMEASR